MYFHVRWFSKAAQQGVMLRGKLVALVKWSSGLAFTNGIGRAKVLDSNPTDPIFFDKKNVHGKHVLRHEKEKILDEQRIWFRLAVPF